jgi:hypothetical protein
VPDSDATVGTVKRGKPRDEHSAYGALSDDTELKTTKKKKKTTKKKAAKKKANSDDDDDDDDDDENNTATAYGAVPDGSALVAARRGLPKTNSTRRIAR